MDHQPEVVVERIDRLALERERHRLAQDLHDRGLITREALERELGIRVVVDLTPEDA